MIKFRSKKRGFKAIGKLDEILAEEAIINASPEAIAINKACEHAYQEMYTNLLLYGQAQWQVKRLSTPLEG